MLRSLLKRFRPSTPAQKSLLEKASSRKTFKKVAADSASLLAHRDSSSLLSYYTDNHSKWSVVFDFDREVLGSKAYERAVRSALKTVVWKRRKDLEELEAHSRAKQSIIIDKILNDHKMKEQGKGKLLLFGKHTVQSKLSYLS